MTTTSPTPSDTSRRDALADSIFQATIGALELMHVYLGDRLGLYTKLAKVDSVTSAELADLAGIGERYAREWLEQQAVAGVLDVTEDIGDARTRRYRLPSGAEEVLCQPDSLYLLAPLAPLVMSIAQTLPQVIDAFRTGGGVPYQAYGADLRNGIARVNRPMFVNQLAADWIPALPDIEEQLRRPDPPAHVADLGCGSGWSTVALARAYPVARLDGIDLDDASIDTARRNAAETGVADRVSFARRDAGDAALAERYNLVTLFETPHDMAHPVESLRAARAMLAPGGAVRGGGEGVAEPFTAPGYGLEGFMSGRSPPPCLPAALIEPDALGRGAVIRPETVRRYALAAAFSTVTFLPIEHDF